MTNRPYEIDMPSLTNLRAMEDEAMGFSPSNSPEHSKVVRQHPATANEDDKRIARAESAERQNLQQCRPGDPDNQLRDVSPADSRETGRMDVDVGTKVQVSNSHERISHCDGHWHFADTVLEGQLGVGGVAKGTRVENPTRSETSTPDVAESMYSNAKLEELCTHESHLAQSADTRHEQEHPIPKDDLLIMLEVGFAERSYWTTADLADALQQPEAYLNEVLPQIAMFGPWLGEYPQRWCWRLKPVAEKHEGRWKGKRRVEFWE